MFRDGIALFSLVLTVVTIYVLTRWNIRPGSRSAIPTQAPFFYRECSNLDSDAEQQYESQKRMDMTLSLYAPHLDDRNENWPEGFLELDIPSHRGRQSIVYPLRDNPSVIVKYQADCEEIKDKRLHPLLVEFWYGKKASTFGIAPDVLFLSAPVAFSKSSVKLARFLMSHEQREACETGGGTVRFAVIQRLGRSVDLDTIQRLFPLGKVPFSIVMLIGISLIEKLRDLHMAAEIVHGDIHTGNIMVERTRDRDIRLWLVDFGRARANLPARSKDPVDAPSMLSPWQIEGYQWSARDDVYNAIRTLALLLNGNAYIEFERRMKQAGPRQVLHWKKNGSIWFLSDQHDPLISLPIGPYRRTAIRQSLNRTITSVRSLHDVDAIPDYENIVREFRQCIDLADTSKPVKL